MLKTLNLGLPTETYENTIHVIVQVSAAYSTLQTNRGNYDLLRSGVKVTYRDACSGMGPELCACSNLALRRTITFLRYANSASMNRFIADGPISLWPAATVHGANNTHRNIRRAYSENLSDYKDTMAYVFRYNAFVVPGNGVNAWIGSYSA